MKKVAYILTLGIAIGIITMHFIEIAKIKKIDNLDVLYQIKITTDYINVREQPTLKAKKITEVLQNEIYEVVEEYQDDEYDWFKIKLQNRRTGWIASKDWVERK